MSKLIAIIFFFCFQLGYSQNLLEHRDTTNLGEGYTYGKRLLLIPFKPYDYKSDADADIAKQNEVEPSLVKLVFRSSIDKDSKNFL